VALLSSVLVISGSESALEPGWEQSGIWPTGCAAPALSKLQDHEEPDQPRLASQWADPLSPGTIITLASDALCVNAQIIQICAAW